MSNYLALKVTDDMFKGGCEQGSSIGENLPHKFSVGTTIGSKVDAPIVIINIIVMIILSFCNSRIERNILYTDCRKP